MQNESSDYEQDLSERKRRRFSIIMLIIALVVSLFPIYNINSCVSNPQKEALLKELNPSIVFVCIYSDNWELGTWFVTTQNQKQLQNWFQSYIHDILPSYYGDGIEIGMEVTRNSFISGPTITIIFESSSTGQHYSHYPPPSIQVHIETTQTGLGHSVAELTFRRNLGAGFLYTSVPDEFALFPGLIGYVPPSKSEHNQCTCPHSNKQDD